MENVNEAGTPEEVKTRSRRKFLKSAAQVAFTAPAVALLLDANMTRAAAAQSYPSQPETLQVEEWVQQCHPSDGMTDRVRRNTCEY